MLTKRSVFRFSIAILSSLVFFLGIANAQDFDKVKIQTINVVDGVYMLMGRGGNIGISAGEDGVFMIDDQYAPLTEKIKGAISAISNKPVRFLSLIPFGTGSDETRSVAVIDINEDEIPKISS